jgi:hypothetical protein
MCLNSDCVGRYTPCHAIRELYPRVSTICTCDATQSIGAWRWRTDFGSITCGAAASLAVLGGYPRRSFAGPGSAVTVIVPRPMTCPAIVVHACRSRAAFGSDDPK